MTLYQKVIAVVGMLRNSINGRASKLDLAPLFDVANSYAVGRLVVYNDVLYRCVVAHSGAWNADHFHTCTIDEIISLTLNDLIYQLEGDLDASSGSGSVRSITLSDTALNFVDFSGVTLSSDMVLEVTLPEVSTATGSRIADTLLRVDIGNITEGHVSVNIQGTVHVLAADNAWSNLSTPNSTTILTFTYVGTKGSTPLWLVGRLTSGYE